MTEILVTTKNAAYVVDRENKRWYRTSGTHPKPDDGEWNEGGFTLGEIGQSCFAHFADRPDGATGRWTSKVIARSDLCRPSRPIQRQEQIMSGDFTNLTEWARRRDRAHNDVRVRAISDDALAAWEEHAPAGATPEVGGAFVTGFDLGRDSKPTDWARIAVLQTERAHIGRELIKSGNHAHTTPTALVDRYDALDKQIREALT